MGFATPTNITEASGVVLHSDYDAAKSAAQAGDSMDMSSISGDSGAADNLEAILDGNGVTANVDLTMRSLTVISDVGSAVHISGSDEGMTIAGSGGPGLEIDGTLFNSSFVNAITKTICGTTGRK